MKLIGTILILIHCTICSENHSKEILSYLSGDKEAFSSKKQANSKTISEIDMNNKDLKSELDDIDSKSNINLSKTNIQNTKINKLSISKDQFTKNVNIKDKNTTNRSTISKEKADSSANNAQQEETSPVISLLINNTRISKETFMEIPFWFEKDLSIISTSYPKEERIVKIKEFLFNLYEKVSLFKLIFNINY